MRQVIPLAPFASVRDALRAMNEAFAAYMRVHKRRETIDLVISSGPEPHQVEVRCYHDKDAASLAELAWFKARVSEPVRR